MLRRAVPLLSVLSLWASQAGAAEFPLTLFLPSFVNDGVTDFNSDYTLWAACSIEIEDAAIAPGAYVDINSAAFRRLECTVKGNDRGYSYSYGSAVAQPDYWSGSAIPGAQLGVRFGSNSKPLRFDAPLISSQSSSYGFYDSPEQGFGGFSTHTFWGPSDDDNFNVPAAVLLEPTVMFGNLRPRGAIVSAGQLPPGAKAALLNGHWVFNEQWLRDADNSPIPNPLSTNGGYYTFDEQLVAPQVRVTQAPFAAPGAEVQLAHERTTAIVLNRTAATEHVRVRVMDRNASPQAAPLFDIDQNAFTATADPDVYVFQCSATNQPAPAFCGLTKDREVSFKVDFEGVELQAPINARVRKTGDLELVYMPVEYADCLANNTCVQACTSGSGPHPACTANAFAAGSNDFIRRTFPLRDQAGLTFVPNPSQDMEGTSVKPAIIGANPSLFLPNVMATLIKMRWVSTKYQAGSPYFRAVGIVPEAFFAPSGLPDSRGVTVCGMKDATLVAVEGTSNVTAHELGHTFGLFSCGATEEYEIFSPGARAEGFDVYRSKLMEQRINFMGDDSPPDAAFWVNESSWNTILERLTSEVEDPPLLFTSLILARNGQVTANDWLELDGIPTPADTGTHRLEMLNAAGSVVATHAFTPDFRMILEPAGTIETDQAAVVVQLPFAADVRSVRLVNAANQTLYSVDPLRKTLLDYLAAVKSSCTLPGATVQSLDQRAAQIAAALDAGAVTTATRDSLIALAQTVLQITAQSCDFASSPFTAPADLSQRLDKLVPRVALRISATPPPVPGDLNGDRLLNAQDYQLIRAALNRCQGHAAFLAAADFNNNGCIGYDDYQIWYALYQNR